MVTSETNAEFSHFWTVGEAVTGVAGASVGVLVKSGVGVRVGACSVSWA